MTTNEADRRATEEEQAGGAGPPPVSVISGIVSHKLREILLARVPATVRCLSHASAHVRALSTALLRLILSLSPSPPCSPHQQLGTMQQHSNTHSINLEQRLHSHQHHLLDQNAIKIQHQVELDWWMELEGCLMRESMVRQVEGLSSSFIMEAAAALGYRLSEAK
eukprot:TRINITY_DN11845_c0_g1_i1.p1 TRINITY_DN11845_c0_g1~~TRINITY_DN11845_c0_g1_i1.p1  ORF type:complete len:165 (+),score=44.62 TRINITY_DN11845_c0_g1_i1:3-497(+)